MTSKEKLENLVRLFHEKKVVERIALSGGDICVFNWQCDMFQEELKSLKEDSLRYGYIIKEEEYWKIPVEDALQISFICIMARIDHFKLLEIYEELPVALRKVKGEWSFLAEKIAYYIGPIGNGDKNFAFLDCSEEELLKILFK